eukprot:Em0004g1561a
MAEAEPKKVVEEEEEEGEEEESNAEKQGHQNPAATGVKLGKKKKKAKREKKSVDPSKPSLPHMSNSNIRDLLSRMQVDEDKKEHQFWDTQPVPKLVEKVTDSGPLEPAKDDVRQEPLSLPNNFKWDDIDLENPSQLDEVYTLLNENYVEDDDNMFRFDYSRPFLQWALQPPGWKKVWHCGVRATTTGKLLGFISAVPACIRIRDHTQTMVEINFLRSPGGSHCQGIFQAVYTAGVLLPKPVASCRYWHRSLNPKKLVDVQFSSIHRHMTLQRMMRLYKLPETTKTIGLRTMEAKDVSTVHALVNKYLEKFDLIPVFESEEDIVHWFLPRPNIISSYVVENPETKVVTDVISFYHLPSTVVSHPVHKTLYAVYSFYNVATYTPMKDLMQDALILAKQQGADVFNALDLMDNKQFLEELKFGTGDGHLRYYLYNWKCPEMPSEKVGLVLQ